MDSASIYDWLIAAPNAAARDAADTHVVASAMVMAIQEARSGDALTEGLGLAGAELRGLLAFFFPHALALLEQFDLDKPVFLSGEESCLKELLSRHTTRRTRFEIKLAAMIARRAMRPNHLWQDLGLRTRGELSAMLELHFEPIARRNKNNMKWKKFFYRMICGDKEFRLCTAPSCSECDDFTECFGEESGESLLARIRRETEMPATVRFSIVALGTPPSPL